MSSGDYISRIGLGIGKCNPDVFENKGYAEGWNAAVGIIEAAPPAEVRPVVRGEWIMCNNACICSNCGNPVAFKLMPDGWHVGDFCTKCGADMRMEIKD